MLWDPDLRSGHNRHLHASVGQPIPARSGRRSRSEWRRSYFGWGGRPSLQAAKQNPNDVGDDVNQVVELLTCKVRLPSASTDQAALLYSAKTRPVCRGCYIGQYRKAYPGDYDAVETTMVSRIEAGIVHGWKPGMLTGTWRIAAGISGQKRAGAQALLRFDATRNSALAVLTRQANGGAVMRFSLMIFAHFGFAGLDLCGRKGSRSAPSACADGVTQTSHPNEASQRDNGTWTPVDYRLDSAQVGNALAVVFDRPITPADKLESCSAIQTRMVASGIHLIISGQLRSLQLEAQVFQGPGGNRIQIDPPVPNTSHETDGLVLARVDSGPGLSPAALSISVARCCGLRYDHEIDTLLRQ